MMQLAPAASVAPQALDTTLKELALTPPRATDEIASGAVPGLESVTVWLGAAVLTTVAKLREAGENTAWDVPVTVPFRAAVWIVALASSVTVKLAV
jgi:hypothetical protein